MAIDPADEGLHPAGSEPNWQESAFLSWYSAEVGVGGIHRIGIEPNLGVGNIWTGICGPNSERYRDVRGEIPNALQDGFNGLSCGGQQIFHDGSTLRLDYVSDACEIDLRITDISVSWGHDTPAQHSAIQVAHFDAHCLVEGVARIDGSEYSVVAYGLRDHSWGPRNWGRILAHRCLVGRFGDDLGYEFFSVLTADGSLSRKGTVIRGSDRRDIVDFVATVALAEDGFSARRASVMATEQDGEVIAMEIEIADGFAVEAREFVGFEAVGTAVVGDGRQNGFAYFAMSNNARAGLGAPPLMMHGVRHDGLAYVRR